MTSELPQPAVFVVPSDRLHDGAADERPDRAAQARDSTPDADRPSPPFEGVRTGDKSEGQRNHDRR
jgi:hypothetical protein